MKIVEEDPAVPPETFDRLRASARLRELLKVIGVGTGIPTKLTRLAEWASNIGSPDGRRVITEMRNGVVHPRKRGDASNTSGSPCGTDGS